jgi:hypothetical protein
MCKDLEGNCDGLSPRTMKTFDQETKNVQRKVTEIETRYFPNTSPEIYRCINQLIDVSAWIVSSV